MAEYIDREVIIRHLEECKGNPPEMCYTFAIIQAIESFVKDVPASDVAPVVHGRWIKPVPGDGENYCSVCKAEQPWFYGYGYFEPDYCPNCGARMDGEQNAAD